jgi:hypothetical protein
MKTAGIFLCSLMVIASISGCSHSYLLKSKKNSVKIVRVNVLGVAYHRPDYPAAEAEDFSNKNRQLDCQLPAPFWSGIDQQWNDIQTCLNGVGNVRLKYRFIADVQPYLEVDQDTKVKNPECIEKFIPKIPLPREIYFMGRDANMNRTYERLNCYSASFNSRSGAVFSTPSKTKVFKVQFPALANRPLKSKADFHYWLMNVVFNLMKSDEEAKGVLWALPVPEEVCRTCFKDDPLFNDKYSGKIRPVFWP